MSTGGNVPTQGVNVTAEKKRGSAGQEGNGTAGKRLKRAWRNRLEAASTSPVSLLSFVRQVAKLKNEDAELAEDAKFWLSCKRPGGSDQQRAERKAKAERVRGLRYVESKSAVPGKKKAG